MRTTTNTDQTRGDRPSSTHAEQGDKRRSGIALLVLVGAAAIGVGMNTQFDRQDTQAAARVEAGSLKDALSGAESIHPSDGILTLNPGVIKRKTPTIPYKNGDPASDSRLEETIKIINPIIIDGNVMIPDENQPLIGEDGTPNLAAFSWVSLDVFDQVDDKSGQAYAEWSYPDELEPLEEGGSLVFSENHVSWVGLDGNEAQVSIVTHQ